MISLYGSTGFIGSHLMKTGKFIGVPREQREAPTSDIIYLISTTDNYNMFDKPYLDIDVNLRILTETLEANRRKYGNKFSFGFASSFFVYGNNELPFIETQLCNPMGFYSISKFAAERYVQTYCRTYNIPYQIYRFANVYGPDDKFSKKKNAFQYLIDKLKNDETVTIYGDGNFVRDMIHVKDVCDAVVYCMENAPDGEIINIGTGQAHRWLSLMKMAKQIIGSKSEFEYIPVPEFHKIVGITNAYLDVSKINSYGWEAKIGIDEGIRSVV